MSPVHWLILILVGLALMAGDVFVPTFGVATLTGLALVVWSLASLFRESALMGWAALAAALAVVAVVAKLGWKWFLRSPYFHRARVEDEPPLADESGTLVGAVGCAATALRPAGKALVRGKTYDALCETGFAEAGAPVRVLAVRGRELLVTPAPDAEAG